MSYLDLPRLHLAGRFFADPSTVNNDPEHYKPEVTRPAPWQMPRGMHYFRFFDCVVKSALDLDGERAADPAIVGASMRSVDQPVPAKIVDLDVYQQGATQIFGLDLTIDGGDAGKLKASMRTPVLNGAWFEAVLPTRSWTPEPGGEGSYGGDSSALGVFQTVLEVKASDWTFSRDGLMEILRRSCEVTTTDDGEDVYLLAFKFVLDGYWNVGGESLFQTGRFVGTIGPLFDTDPTETLGARWLEPRTPDPAAPWYVPRFYRAPFRLDDSTQTLQIDWAGSVTRQSFGGDPVDLGEVTAVAMTDEGPEELGSFVVDERSYVMRAGITDIPLSPSKFDLASKNAIELRTSREDLGPRTLFAERSDGIAIATQCRNIRMTSDEGRDTSKAEANIVCRKFGRPLVGVTPKVFAVPVEGDTPGATVPPTNPGDTPAAKGALQVECAESDAEGIATISLEAVEDPGSRTAQLDGQLYFVYAQLGGRDPSKKPPVQEQQISVLVWSRYEVQENPDWGEIQRLMTPYAKLYPGMTDKFDVSKKDAFIFYSNNPGAPFFVGPGNSFEIPGHPEIQDGAIPYYLTLPIENPKYMPVSRDLSPPKIETILNFISNEQARIKAQVAKDDAEHDGGGGGA